MAAPRVSIADLLTAAEWCGEGYEPGPDDENGPALARVAEWLRREVAAREREATAREIARRVAADTGRTVTLAQARAAVDRTRAARATRTA